MNKKTLLTATIVLVFDQLSKALASTYLKLNVPKKIIKNFFYLTFCENDGIAWGLFSNHQALIIIFTIVALLVIYKFIYSFKNNSRNNIAFGLIIGGLFGNLADRILFGSVRDFFDFTIFNYDYPVFNIADIAIVVGVILLIIAIFKGEDLSENNSKRGKRKTR